MNNASKKLEQIALIASATILTFGVFLVIKPFISSILWALILVLVTWPVYSWLSEKLRNRKKLAASILISSYTVLMLIPLVLLAWSLADNVKDIYVNSVSLLEGGLPQPPAWLENIPVVGTWLKSQWQDFASNPDDLIRLLKKIALYSRDMLLSASAYLGQGILYTFLSIFLSFFIYCDGEKYAKRLTFAITKIAGEKSQRLIVVAGATLRSVVYGIIGTALAQGILAGLGFILFKVPNPVFLGFLTTILSPIPAGPPLIWGGAAAWLFYSGSTWLGIAVILWGILVVSSIDNFLKPYIISKGSKMPLSLVLLGVMGGAFAFGVLGVFLGPALLAVARTVFHEWYGDSDRQEEAL